MGFFKKLFGDYSSRELKSIQPTVNQIEAKADAYKEMSEEELKGMTGVLRGRLENGETLDQILPDAFATVREAADRVLGLRPYRVQLMGGIILHQGRIAEMKTGEGKTLVATLPAYLNALTGEGVHVVTVNDYLARRDSEWMGKVYRYLGLTVGLIVPGLSTPQRQSAYAADITYATNNELGFDYLRDNMAIYASQLVQRGHVFAIVDEVDSILIDEARTPLIISGRPVVSEADDPGAMYKKADDFVKGLKVKVVTELDSKEAEAEDEDADYIVDEKARSATLTSNGIQKAEAFFHVENLGDARNSELSHYINQALRARGVMKRDVDYIVQDGTDVIIVDEFTGRLMYGRRYNNGLHQAIEAKEGVKVASENQTLATITFQNFFRMYRKLSGMTGTAMTEQEEFGTIYNLDIVEIPTNRENRRVDHEDLLFATERAKLAHVVDQIKECHEKGQPVLVGTVSIEKNLQLSRLLEQAGFVRSTARKGIGINEPANCFHVLNATNHEQEAAIVAQAGKLGAITIATNMAGRGTDIMLGGNAEYFAQEDLKREILQHLQTGVVNDGKDGYISAIQNQIARAVQQRLAQNHQVMTPQDFTNFVVGTSAQIVYSEATGFANSSDPGIQAARAYYRRSMEEHRAQIRDEAEKVRAAGGLFIIGTVRNDSRRIDNQLRGRAGRQGDPGETRFYVSFEDDLARLFGGTKAQGIMTKLAGEDDPLEGRVMSKTIETAQTTVESRNFQARKSVLEYDDVMNKQREIIYEQRREVLDGMDMRETILNMIHTVIENRVASACMGQPSPEREALHEMLGEMRGLYFSAETFPEEQESELLAKTAPELTELLYGAAEARYEEIEAEGREVDRELTSLRQIEQEELQRQRDAKAAAAGTGTAAGTAADKGQETGNTAAGTATVKPVNSMRETERNVLLRAVDEHWMEHIDAMDDLKQGVRLRAYGNTDPVIAYKQESLALFDDMIASIQRDTVETMFRIDLREAVKQKRRQVAKILETSTSGAAPSARKNTSYVSEKIGPNDDCPCGSGLKYKKCTCAEYHPNQNRGSSDSEEGNRVIATSSGPNRQERRRRERAAVKEQQRQAAEKDGKKQPPRHAGSKKKKKR